MYFDLFLSLGSSPQTLINQYHNLNLGALSRRIKLQIANFQGEKKYISFAPHHSPFSNTYEGSCVFVQE